MNIVRIASLSSSVLLAFAVAACSSDGTPSSSGGTSGTSGGTSGGNTSGGTSGGTSGSSGGTSGSSGGTSGSSGGTSGSSGGTSGSSGSSSQTCSSAALNGRCLEGPSKGKSCCMPDDETTCSSGTDCDTVCEYCK
jgi:hypothetical protein